MFKTLLLILPVLIPSWRFFKTIEPSPRVQWALVDEGGTASAHWHEFRPLPEKTSLPRMGLRLLWNPHRNDDLFVISCAERIQDCPTPHSIAEIRQRIQRDIAAQTRGALVQFRLAFVRRDRDEIVEDIVYLSDPFPAAAPDTC